MRLFGKRICMPWLMLTLLWMPLNGTAQSAERSGKTLVDSGIAGETVSPVSTPKPATARAGSGTLALTLNEAVLIALENNRALAVERLTPTIQQTYEAQQRAVFDPRVEANASMEHSEVKRQLGGVLQSVESDSIEAGLSLKEYFPTGTFVELTADTLGTETNLNPDPFVTTTLGLDINQSLLKDFGRDVNLVRLRQAQTETDISNYELRGFTESLIARIEDAYWDYGLAIRQIEIVQESLKLAQQQLDETREMIAVGTLAEAELVAGQAEVAVQEQGLINAKSSMSIARITLLKLLNPPGDEFWERDVQLVHQPTLPEVELDDVITHVATALKMRPEINQAKLAMQLGDLELVRTKNGLLPRLDLFIFLGKSGYADSFGGSVSDLSGDSYRVAGGFSFDYPFRNRSAKAEHRRATLTREQSAKALDNLDQLISLDVRTAYIEVQRTREQIDASRATRILQDENLRIETEKFRVGRSTALLVAGIQRDFLVSRINEVQSVVNYLKALTSFYRLEGTLLVRRGIQAPGADSVDRP
jgi:outer membrane protein TolC